jgi:hypothetical protein
MALTLISTEGLPVKPNRGASPLVLVANSVDWDRALDDRSLADPIAESARDMACMSGAEFSRQDIAEVNLACAAGLPGSEGLNIAKCLDRLEEWTDYAKRKTHRALQNKGRFREYDDWPDGRYRALILQMAIQNDLDVKSNHERMSQPYDGSDSRDLFIHAVLTELHLVMCATAPVVYAAIGRRLGYPIHLVKTKCHVFCRWDDPNGERFNIEPTNPGFISYSDEHYRTWPFEWTAFEKTTECWLRNLSPREELGMFLDARGTCWFENFQSEFAGDCFSASCLLNNGDPDVQKRWAMATVLHPVVERLRPHVSDVSQPLTVTLPTPRDKWQQQCLPVAKDWLDTIIRNRRKKAHDALQQFTYTEIVTAM